jgi:hypothetical protein
MRRRSIGFGRRVDGDGDDEDDGDGTPTRRTKPSRLFVAIVPIRCSQNRQQLSPGSVISNQVTRRHMI